MKTCHKCGSDLTLHSSVSRLYISKDDKGEDSYVLGHYEGDFFESDTNPSYPLKHHDLLDNSDECQGCGSVVG